MNTKVLFLLFNLNQGWGAAYFFLALAPNFFQADLGIFISGGLALALASWDAGSGS